MSVRTFIFCDSCNPQAVRHIDNRYNDDRRDEENERDDGVRRQTATGRRNTDGRAWYEGSVDIAIQHGWAVNDNSSVLCPDCVNRTG